LAAQRKLAFDGRLFKIAFARDRSGVSLAEQFFDELDLADKAKLIQLFRILGDHGKTSNREKFGDLGNGIFEFKSFQIRMPFTYATYERGLVVITHGFRKKRNDAPPAEIEKAKRIIQEDAAASKVRVITDQKAKGRRQ
jgi:phage-related protein